jgi:hypothetical protein
VTGKRRGKVAVLRGDALLCEPGEKVVHRLTDQFAAGATLRFGRSGELLGLMRAETDAHHQRRPVRFYRCTSSHERGTFARRDSARADGRTGPFDSPLLHGPPMGLWRTERVEGHEEWAVAVDAAQRRSVQGHPQRNVAATTSSTPLMSSRPGDADPPGVRPSQHLAHTGRHARWAATQTPVTFVAFDLPHLVDTCPTMWIIGDLAARGATGGRPTTSQAAAWAAGRGGGSRRRP